MNMKQFISCLLFGTLFGITPLPSPTQQNQNAQHSAREIEVLKRRVSELEKQLQIVENVEKLDLQAKLAEANAKLLNAELGKFQRILRDRNDEWLRTWSHWFLGIIGVFVALFLAVGAVFWFWLRSTANQLIADEVEKNLNGFKEALTGLNILKNQLGVLEKEHALSVLEDYLSWPLHDEHSHPQPIMALREEALLKVLADERYNEERHGLRIKCKAGEVLALPSALFEVEKLNFVVECRYDNSTYLFD